MKIKICGLSRKEDIQAVNKYRPDYCGFILEFPKSRRNISFEKARKLRGMLCSAVTPVGVFVDQTPETIEKYIKAGIIDIVQLHGTETPEYIEGLRDAIAKADTEIWQAFRICDAEDIRRAEKSPADLVLLDAGQGAGETFDWSLLGKIERPFALAGGINAGNTEEACRTGAVLLDVSSGVETDGFKDAGKIKEFIGKVRKIG